MQSCARRTCARLRRSSSTALASRAGLRVGRVPRLTAGLNLSAAGAGLFTCRPASGQNSSVDGWIGTGL